MQIELEEYIVEDDDEDEDQPRHKYYASNKILGVLYRGVDEQRVWAEDIRGALPTGGASVWQQLLRGFDRQVLSVSPGGVKWRRRSEEARGIRDV